MSYRWPQGSEQLRQWFAVLSLIRVHVHHVLGFAQSFWQLLDELQLPIDLTLHDHSIFTGNPSLLDHRGKFDPSWLDNGLTALPAGDAEVARVLSSLAIRAQRVIVPSHALADKLATFFPSLDVLVRSHPEREVGGPYPAVLPRLPVPQQPFKVLCLGMLGLEKGAYVLERVARMVDQLQLDIEFVLLGACHVDLPPSVDCKGLYQDVELLALIAESAPHLLWLPAQCPETWSYTLSAGLRAGLPVLASDLGALPERLGGRPLTQLLAHTASAEQWLAAIQELQADIASAACAVCTGTADQVADVVPVVDTASAGYPVQLYWAQPPATKFYTAEPSEFAAAPIGSPTARFMASSRPISSAERVAATAAGCEALAGGCYIVPPASCSSGPPVILQLPAGLAEAQRLALKQGGRWRIWLLKVIYVASRWSWLARLLRYVPYRWQRRIKRAVSRAPLDKRIVSK